MRSYHLGLLLLLFSFSCISSPSIENPLSAGTTIKTRMAEPIDSRVRRAGYRFKITVDSDIKKADKVIIKSGSQAYGVINKIRKSGKGQDAPEIVVTLTVLSVNNRPQNVHSFPIAGKGTTSARKAVGEVDENEFIVIGQQGEQITASIPLLTRGYDFTLTEGTILYFILKQPIAF